MRQTIRFKTFETNSSSTHSCCLLSDDEYIAFKNGELYWDNWHECFKTKAEVEEEFKNSDESSFETWVKNIKKYTDPDTNTTIYLLDGEMLSEEEIIKEYNENYSLDCWEEFLRDSDYTTYENFGRGFETDEQERIINGVTVHALCYYGYDG